MDFENKVKFSKSTKLLKGENKTLLASMDNGESIFISNECLNIFNEAEKENLSFKKLLDCIEDKESRDYLKNLINKIDSYKMWKHSEIENYPCENMNISLDITNNCNLRCKHCCVNAGEDLRGEDLPTEKILSISKKLAEINPVSITISGGEPLIRSDFKEITKTIRDTYKGTLTLMTNGVLIDDDMAKFISENYTSVDVSLDGYNEETCSTIRGKGTFEKVMKGISFLKKYNCKISASMVVTKETENYKKNFMDLCKENGIFGMLRTFDAVGRGKNNETQLKVVEEDIESIDWKRVEEKFVKNKVFKERPQIFACQGAKREFQIDHKGNVFPCASFMDDEYILFNVNDVDNLKDYLERGEFKKSIGYKNFIQYIPCNVKECSNCNKQLLCFSCARTVRDNVKNNTIKNVCKEYSKYYDMYWRYNGTI